MLLYHGSNLIVNEPRLLAEQRNLDFGAGFYCTTNKRQAVGFSQKVCERIYTNTGSVSGAPTVSIYEIDVDVAKKALSVLEFPLADEAWLAFVAQNRRGIYKGKIYDLVVGKVANDNVFPNILAYLSGLQSSAVTLQELQVKPLFDQYTFKTAKALSFLKFVGTVPPQGGV